MDISDGAQEAINGAFEYAYRFSHAMVTPEHLLFSILDKVDMVDLLRLSGADTKELKQDLFNFFQEEIPILTENKNMEPMQSRGFRNVLNNSLAQSRAADKKRIDITDLLVSIYDESNNSCSWFLHKAGVNRLALLKAINLTGNLISGSFAKPENEARDKSEESAREEQPAPEKKRKSKSAVEQFAVDLTKLAREGALEPLIGRETELERTVQILLRRTRNNPLHVGEAGVGKTAITEGLAQRIVAGTVPEALRDHTIYRLDIASLVAGTKFRGDFEERIKKIVDEIVQRKNVVLFFDEIHTIIGAGSVSSDSLDAANLLKPVLAAGKIRCIGATTYDEYSRYFEKDRALSRRFQKIDIDEPGLEQSREILFGLKKRYEQFHNAVYTDEALEQAVALSSQFITDRRLPDKAIDVIDEAGAYMRMQNGDSARTVVDESVIERVVAKIARVPEKSVSSSEKEKLKTLETRLLSDVFGQESAVRCVCEAVKRSRAGFRQADKPVANFLFVGPTGVGKTELAKSLAAQLGVTLHRFDMSEYQEKHTVSRLIGSPPGYVGFEDGGFLTAALRKQPHAVVLLDEIEKAHSDIFNVLLQIMDYATLTDNQGRKADFRNAVLIMTSNAGAREASKSLIGFGDRTAADSVMREAVEKIFPPEFRNRLDAVVTFSPLPRESIRAIIERELNRVRAVLADKNVTLEVSDECEELLVDLCYTSEFGARNAARIIDEKISSFFVDEMLFGALTRGGAARAVTRDGEVAIELL